MIFNRLTILVIIYLFSNILYAQETVVKVISGTIIDSKRGKGIENVTVSIVEQSEFSTITDRNGIFIIRIPLGEPVYNKSTIKLMAIHIDYIPVKIIINPDMPIEIKMVKKGNNINPYLSFLLTPIPIAYETYSQKNSIDDRIFLTIGLISIGAIGYSYYKNDRLLERYENRKKDRIFIESTFEFRKEVIKWHYINKYSWIIYGFYVLYNISNFDYNSLRNNTYKFNKSKISRYYFLYNKNSFLINIKFFF